MMFLAKSSSPKFTSWPTVLMFIFGVTDVGARVLNTLNFEFLRGRINKNNVLYFCLVDYVACIVPLLTYLASMGRVPISPLACDVLNGIFYGFLAFNFGYLFIAFSFRFLLIILLYNFSDSSLLSNQTL